MSLGQSNQTMMQAVGRGRCQPSTEDQCQNRSHASQQQGHHRKPQAGAAGRGQGHQLAVFRHARETHEDAGQNRDRQNPHGKHGQKAQSNPAQVSGRESGTEGHLPQFQKLHHHKQEKQRTQSDQTRPQDLFQNISLKKQGPDRDSDYRLSCKMASLASTLDANSLRYAEIRSAISGSLTARIEAASRPAL